jgi:hypothetical protein
MCSADPTGNVDPHRDAEAPGKHIV